MTAKKINWDLYKGLTEGYLGNNAKEGYIDFVEKLEEVGATLISYYYSSTDKVTIQFRNKEKVVNFNCTPNNFKRQTYLAIIKMKEECLIYNDTYNGVVGTSESKYEKLIVNIQTKDNYSKDMILGKYKEFYLPREEFEKQLKEAGITAKTPYISNVDDITVFFNNIEYTSKPRLIKSKTIPAVNNFKQRLIENKDELIEFVDITDNNTLVARIKIGDGKEITTTYNQYSRILKTRNELKRKIEYINGKLLTPFIKSDEMIKIQLDKAIIEIRASKFGRLERQVKDFLSSLENQDKFIEFTKITKQGLFANIENIDIFNNKSIIEVVVSTYPVFCESRKRCYEFLVKNNYTSKSNYINIQEKMLIDFNCGHEPNLVQPHAFKNDVGCPRCNESKGEKEVARVLDALKYEYIKQYKFEDCKDKAHLPFDFFLLKLNICIEYDGEQHFHPVDFNNKGPEDAEKQFKLLQKRDKIKTKYCKDNNIKLIRIKYTQINEIEEILKNKFNIN